MKKSKCSVSVKTKYWLGSSLTELNGRARVGDPLAGDVGADPGQQQRLDPGLLAHRLVELERVGLGAARVQGRVVVGDVEHLQRR